MLELLSFYFPFCPLGLPELMDALKKDHDAEPISLCFGDPQESGGAMFACFKSAEPLEHILNKFNFLNHEYQNAFFRSIWKDRRSKVDFEITIQDVVTKLWDPVFEECSKIIDDVRTRNMKLKDVDHYFGSISEPRLIKSELQKLYKGVEACNSRKATEYGWIEEAVSRIKQYWSLRDQAKAAETVLKLKNRLALTGNFTVIENVAQTKLMEDKKLNAIDEKLIQAKTFLEKFTQDKQKLDCLKKFADCLDVVEWIRKETKGIF